MNVKIIFFSILIVSVLLETGADFFFKKWAIESKNIVLIFGLLLYIIASIFFAVSLKYEFLSKTISIFSLLNLLAITLVGILFFKEHLTILNKIGVGLAIISIILIEL